MQIIECIILVRSQTVVGIDYIDMIYGKQKLRFLIKFHTKQV